MDPYQLRVLQGILVYLYGLHSCPNQKFFKIEGASWQEILIHCICCWILERSWPYLYNSIKYFWRHCLVKNLHKKTSVYFPIDGVSGDINAWLCACIMAMSTIFCLVVCVHIIICSGPWFIQVNQKTSPMPLLVSPSLYFDSCTLMIWSNHLYSLTLVWWFFPVVLKH